MSKPLDQHDNPFTAFFKSGTAVTPSGTTTAQANTPHSGIYVGGAGDLAVQFATGGSEVVYTCQAGALLPIQVAYINSTNTTATNIILQN